MRYLSGSPFSVAVGNGKITQEQWERAVGLPQRPSPARTVERREARCTLCGEFNEDCQCYNTVPK